MNQGLNSLGSAVSHAVTLVEGHSGRGEVSEAGLDAGSSCLELVLGGLVGQEQSLSLLERRQVVGGRDILAVVAILLRQKVSQSLVTLCARIGHYYSTRLYSKQVIL